MRVLLRFSKGVMGVQGIVVEGSVGMHGVVKGVQGGFM